MKSMLMVATITIIGTTFSGNKGTVSMLKSAIQNISDLQNIGKVHFNVLTIYYKEDKKKQNDRINVISCTPFQLILVNILSFLLVFLRCIHIPTKFLERNKIINAVLKCDLFIDMGGITFVDERKKFLIYNIACILPPILLKKKTIKLSQALGPFDRFPNKFFAKYLLPKMEYIVARGSITEKYLKTLSIPSEKIILCADTAFSLKVDKKYIPDPTVDIPKFLKEGRLVGVSPSSVIWKKCRKEKNDYPRITAGFIDHLIEDKNYDVVIIPYSIRPNSIKNMNNDLNICREIYKRVKNKENCHKLTNNYEPEELRLIIRSMDFMVVSRFHAMVSSLSEKVPTLVVGWSHKYKEVLDMFELSDFTMGTDNLTISLLIDNFEKIENDVE